jgi:hypothetical protein
MPKPKQRLKNAARPDSDLRETDIEPRILAAPALAMSDDPVAAVDPTQFANSARPPLPVPQFRIPHGTPLRNTPSTPITADFPTASRQTDSVDRASQIVDPSQTAQPRVRRRPANASAY